MAIELEEDRIRWQGSKSLLHKQKFYAIHVTCVAQDGKLQLASMLGGKFGPQTILHTEIGNR